MEVLGNGRLRIQSEIRFYKWMSLSQKGFLR
jgi:hypothetical protein